MSKASEAWFQEALAAARAGDGTRAMSLLEAAHRGDRRHTGIRNALAVLRLESGDAAGAIPLLESLIRELPNVPAIRLNFGNALVAAGQAARAVGVLERAVSQRADDPLLWYGLGRAQQIAGDPDAAVQSYERTLRLNPAHPDARANLAAAYNFLGDFAAGEAQARRALQHVPNDPGATFNLAVALLSTRQWAEGWAAYEARQQTRMLDAQRRQWVSPRWSGRGQPGDAILVHAEQGLGDTIQFVRYLPLLRALGYRVVLQCPATLVSLVRAADLCDDVRAFADEVPPYQWHIPLTSLPHVLQLHDDQRVFGTGSPYLRAPIASAVADQPAEMPRPLRLGLVWAGSPTHVNDMHRSCGFQAVKPLLKISGVEWVNLQLGPVGDIRIAEEVRWVDERDRLGSFADTARLLATLDAVVSIDSAVAHLAGAMGMPCWLLLPKIGMDWRWVAEGSDCRWYASMRPVRQELPGQWHQAIGQVASGLAAMLAERSAT